MCTGTVEGCICFAEYKMQPAIQDQEEPPLSVKKKNSALLKILRGKKMFISYMGLRYSGLISSLASVVFSETCKNTG